jgi:hypothetical protein
MQLPRSGLLAGTNPVKRALLAVAAMSIAVTCLVESGCFTKHSDFSAHRRNSSLDFNADVQPILASNCFSCHGPDPGNRKGGLRLDLEETALKKRSGRKDAIVPGHPDQSEMIARIESKDPHHLMPQTAEGEAKPMKPTEIAILKKWIAEGAHYDPHWAFDAPKRPDVPKLKDATWSKTPVDSFVLAKLEAQDLRPSVEADKATLIRRVTLDLTGLLPTSEQVEAFEKDSSPKAYEKVVEQLLTSPKYGEQRTRYWLDYARYSDTHGLHWDNFRMIWPYRDYLIKAFNSNMPFDRFVKEQIAGDMLPVNDYNSLLATGYVRAGISSNEGGAIPEELRFNLARERTEAYGAVFLGLTVGCAVCHDHKYDPTTQKDFYQLSAFFNNINEDPFNGDRPDWWPILRLPKPENAPAYNQLLAQRSMLRIQLSQAESNDQKKIGDWIDSKRAPQSVSQDGLQLRLRLDEGQGTLIKNSAPHATIKEFHTTKVAATWGETTWLWPDFRMDTNTQLQLGQTGDFERTQAFSVGGWIMPRMAGGTGRPRLKEFAGPDPNDPSLKAGKIDAMKDKKKGTGELIAKSDASQGGRGWEMFYNKRSIVINLVNQWPEKAISVSADPALTPTGLWKYIFFTYDGSGKAAGVHLYIDGASVPTKIVSDTLDGTIRTSAPMQLGWRSPDADPYRFTRFQDLRLYARALSPTEAARLPYENYVAELAKKRTSKWNADEWHTASQYYFSTIDDKAKALQAQIDSVNTQLQALGNTDNPYAFSLVAEEKPSLAYANVLARGVYTDRQERVLADTPHFLPALAKNEPHNRLGLADWTVSAQNPLTARVAVNRMWNEVFGTGIVASTDDFGIMGQRPSNPELLNWLAVEFRESGWDVKHMYKLLVMSAAYRQSAKATPELLARDPNNLLLARGPRFRMDAEMLRDIALESSGLLVDKIGGPSVKTYMPANVWETVSYTLSDTLHYTQDHGDALYRRSLYTFWKRFAISPDMEAFDAPARDVVCTRRQRTNTPLQALVTMNDPQWIEASRMLAERSVREGGATPAERINFMSQTLLSHPASPKMTSTLQRSYQDMRKHYSADGRAANQLLAVGETPRDTKIPAPELAAWTMVASEMLNLDETLNK